MSRLSFPNLGGGKKRPKYGNTKTAGKDSKREHQRGRHLELLQRAGEITDLQAQVKYELIPAQRGEDGKIIERACSYLADYQYRDKAGQLVVEDVKGVRTDAYVIKRKLMLHRHGIQIREIK